MKKCILPIVALLLFSFVSSENGLTKDERKKAVFEMNKTLTHLVKTVNGLSDAQLNFKSSPESWSIAECVEHLAKSEVNIFGMLEGALQTPADASRRDEVKHKDDDLLVMIADRSNKVKTSAAFEPSGEYGSFEETLQAFTTERKEHMSYVTETEDDLRNHYANTPVGIVDGYQILLFMSGHTERHVLQMEEVMTHADFPKK